MTNVFIKRIQGLQRENNGGRRCYLYTWEWGALKIAYPVHSLMSEIQNVGYWESEFFLLKPYKLWYFATVVPKISIVIVTLYCVVQFYFKKNFLFTCCLPKIHCNLYKSKVFDYFVFLRCVDFKVQAFEQE